METKQDHFMEPKSWCYCGHLGDGPSETPSEETTDPMQRTQYGGFNPMWKGQHGGFNGHGRCEVEGCDCEQFTWKRFTNRFNEWRAKQ